MIQCRVTNMQSGIRCREAARARISLLAFIPMCRRHLLRHLLLVLRWKIRNEGRSYEDALRLTNKLVTNL